LESKKQINTVLTFDYDIRAFLGRGEPALPLCLRVMLKTPTSFPVMTVPAFVILFGSLQKMSSKPPSSAAVGR
jgi:hypothetical protein